MAKPATVRNTLPEVWHPTADRVPDRSDLPAIHQGAPMRLYLHTTELLGIDDGQPHGERLPDLDELRAWYEREPYPYHQVYAHHELTAKAYIATGHAQRMRSVADVREGYTRLLQRRPITRMAAAMVGADRTGGYACNYASPITIQIAILGCAADAQRWSDDFWADLATVLASNYALARTVPGYEDVQAEPYQTAPGTGGGWGDGRPRALGGDGRKTGDYRMARQEQATGIRADGQPWNLAGHIHAIARNRHWDPSSYVPWVELANEINHQLDGQPRPPAGDPPARISTPAPQTDPDPDAPAPRHAEADASVPAPGGSSIRARQAAALATLPDQIADLRQDIDETRRILVGEMTATETDDAGGAAGDQLASALGLISRAAMMIRRYRARATDRPEPPNPNETQGDNTP